jgi:two-component system response regulator FixJ
MTNKQLVHIIEEDTAVSECLAKLLHGVGFQSQLHMSVPDFLKFGPSTGCVLCDVAMPGRGGLELLEELKKRRIPLPTILTSAFADVPLAVQAMKLGAFDFIEKPIDDKLVISSVRAALARQEVAIAAGEKLKQLTAREKEVLAGLLKGKLNKTIAGELGVSVRTVETHRANLMLKTRAQSLPELIRMTVLSEVTDFDDL